MDLSLIIVNYNTKKLLGECIESIIKNTKKIKYEIIVVDNASSDGSVEKVKEYQRKPIIKLIRNANNLGFAAANNQGIRASNGKYILLLNSDIVINDNLLAGMLMWMDKHRKVGIASCALKNADGSLQGTGGHFPDLFRVFAWMFFLEDIPLLDKLIKPFHPMHGLSPFYKGEEHFLRTKQQDWVTGAFFLTRRKTVDEVGFLDEDYFMYVEELDFCFRAKRAGWEVWYLPAWSIVHLGGASSTAEFPILSEYKSIKLFYKKHKPNWQFPILRFFLKAGALARLVLFGLLKGGGAKKTYAKAYKIA